MNCHEAQTLMHGYLDGELGPPTTGQFEQHVGECPACAGALAEQKVLHAEMKSDALYYRAPENLRERLRATLRQGSAGHRVGFPWRWVAAAACAGVLVGVGFLLGQFTAAPSRHDRLAQEIASAHIRSLQVEHQVDVDSSDRHTVKPWFNGKLDFSPPMRDVEGFPLVGGRLDYVDGRSVAALVYRRRDHVINVFLWPDAANSDTLPRRETRQSYHIVHWSRGGMHYWAVSDLNLDEVDDLVRKLRE
jgi:anti-sigma factor RsiW